MIRTFAILAATALFTLPILAQDQNKPAGSLKLMVVVADGDQNLISEVVVTRVKYVPQTRTETANGITRNVTVNVPVQETVTGRSVWKLKDVKVFDSAGAKIDPDKLPEMFKKPMAVVVSSSGKIDKAFRDILKDNALIVVLPPAPAAK